MRPLDSAVAPLGVTGAASCHSDWSDERDEERDGGISGEHQHVCYFFDRMNRIFRIKKLSVGDG